MVHPLIEALEPGWGGERVLEPLVHAVHGEVALGLAGVGVGVGVVVEEQPHLGPAHLVEGGDEEVRALAVRAQDAREQAVLGLVAEGAHEGAGRQHGDAPTVREAGHGRDGVVAGGAQEHVRRAVDVHVDGGQRPLRLRALGVGRVEHQTSPGQPASLSDGLHGVLHGGQDLGQHPRVGAAVGQDDAQLDVTQLRGRHAGQVHGQQKRDKRSLRGHVDNP